LLATQLLQKIIRLTHINLEEDILNECTHHNISFEAEYLGFGGLFGLAKKLSCYFC